ncbi:uridylate-specific endoribonuclease D-like [Watersipora subatra]|uniref:uridylate-specific endoribonuclease D-like n=1 Tax=Watersipora subatra TaxID=2589382 RepID=UPI00355AEF0E
MPEHLAILAILLTLSQPVRLTTSQYDLARHMQAIWDLDTNRYQIGLQLQLNLQGKASLYNDVDKASGKLFQVVPNLTKKSTYKKFINLLNNYDPLIHKTDRASATEREEQNNFINSVLGTPVWQETRKFLIKHGLVQSNMALAHELQRIWFTEYSRTGQITGSSGFEHVFVGEIDTSKQQISGLHNWVRVYMLEASRSVNYQGYIKTNTKNNLYEIKLRQGNNKKSGNSMFIGTSPEYELAVYTVCFFARPNQKCSFGMNGNLVTIQVYVNYDKSLGSAYPII